MVDYLRLRLLRDIAELQIEPYTNIALHTDNDLTQACLILSPEGQEPLHLTMFFDGYPLRAPRVTIQSKVYHPNVSGGYICASILNTSEGYTPAYTLKSVAIQLLSFFSSETLEQEHGGQPVDLKRYRYLYSTEPSSFSCKTCGFDDGTRHKEDFARRWEEYFRPTSMVTSRDSRMKPAVLSKQNLMERSVSEPKQARGSKQCEVKELLLKDIQNAMTPTSECAPPTLDLVQKFLALPDEILLTIFSHLSDEDLWAVARVFPVTSEILNSYDFIRVRELQCFCLKESFMSLKLGVGVHVRRRGREGTFESEFDLLSQKAFLDYEIRTSVQGLHFEHWLPLPISRRHWRSVRVEVFDSLRGLASAAKLKDQSVVNVIYHFMNDIVVKLSQEAEKCFDYDSRSSLTHASAKAVESYFALFHLLLCLANEDTTIISIANATVDSFLNGRTSKSSTPSLGHLLVAALVSDAGMTEQLRLAVIKEAILRNVVWMLDVTGANMPELAYLEPSAVSEYRLRRSFQASKTSYRLLIFLTLFCRTARPEGISLPDLCYRIFDAHGAPPHGIAEVMASEIRRIKDIDSFPPFFIAMGVNDMPSKEILTDFLRRMVVVSEEKGYSRMPITQAEALGLRKRKEPEVEVDKEVTCGLVTLEKTTASFFPRQGSRRGGGTRRGWPRGRR